MDDPINAADSLRFIETCGDGDFIRNQQLKPAQPIARAPTHGVGQRMGATSPK
jgi:hypothetical protein